MMENIKEKKSTAGKSAIHISPFWIGFTIIFCSALIVCVKIFIDQDVSKSRIQARAQVLQEQEELVKRENQEILSEQNRIHTDAYIEAYARERLGMVKEGEIIYKTR